MTPQLRVRLRLQDVGDDLGNRILLQRAKPQQIRAGVDQLGQRRDQLRRALAGSRRDKPRHRAARQPPRKQPQRGCGATVSPLHVVKADEQRVVQGRLVEQSLDIAQQPEPLLRHRVHITQCSPVHQRWIRTEQRLHQRRQLDNAVDRIGHAASRAKSHALGAGPRRLKHPCLAQTGAAFNHHHGADAVARLLQALTEHGQLRVSPTDRQRR